MQRERDTHTLVIHTPKICIAWLNKANVYTVQSTCAMVGIALRFLEHTFDAESANSEITFQISF